MFFIENTGRRTVPSLAELASAKLAAYVGRVESIGLLDADAFARVLVLAGAERAPPACVRRLEAASPQLCEGPAVDASKKRATGGPDWSGKGAAI